MIGYQAGAYKQGILKAAGVRAVTVTLPVVLLLSICWVRAEGGESDPTSYDQFIDQLRHKRIEGIRTSMVVIPPKESEKKGLIETVETVERTETAETAEAVETADTAEAADTVAPAAVEAAEGATIVVEYPQDAVAPPLTDMAPARSMVVSVEAAGVDAGQTTTEKAFVPESNPKSHLAQMSESERLMYEHQQRLANRRITINTEGMSLGNLVRWLSIEAGLSIVVPPKYATLQVGGMYLDETPILDALESVLASHDLAMDIRRGGSGIIMITERSKIQGEEEVFMQTVRFKLNWVRADEIQKVLDPLLEETKGAVSIDMRSNTVIVSTTPAMIKTIREIVPELDQPDKQVEIEARFVELTQTAGRNLGISWDIYRNDSHSIVSPNGFADPITPNLYGFESAGFSRYPVSITPGGVWEWGDTFDIDDQEFNLALQLRAFEDSGEAETLANPRVATINNVPAIIRLETQIPYEEVTIDESGQMTATATFAPVGIQMQVTPIITDTGYVNMEIVATQAILERMQNLPRAGEAPVIKERHSTTSRIIRDGDTAALMGLRQLDISNSTISVPWLGKIPFLGWLFRNTDDDQRKQDLAVFVTPRILTDLDLSEDLMDKYERIDMRWDLPDYYFDDTSMPSDDMIR